MDFNGEVLARKRKKLRLSLASVASQLTLSHEQINSIEKNLMRGFVTPYFKKLAMRRYAKLLDVDFKKVVTEKTALAQAENSISPTNKVRTFPTVLILVICLLSGFLIIQLFSLTSADKIEDNLSITALENKIVAEMTAEEMQEQDTLPIVIDDISQTKDVSVEKQETKVIASNEAPPVASVPIPAAATSVEFLCTIRNAKTIEYNTKNPEKPATYFHLISIEPQTICAVDSTGNFKTVQLEKEGRFTFRGQPPFKLQFDPAKSRLFFQGWIVRSPPDHYFIQLNPTELPETFNSSATSNWSHAVVNERLFNDCFIPQIGCIGCVAIRKLFLLNRSLIWSTICVSDSFFRDDSDHKSCCAVFTSAKPDKITPHLLYLIPDL